MYSIGFLGVVMILEAFGRHFPYWFSPLNTIGLLAVFLFLSWREIRLKERQELSSGQNKEPGIG
jgi:hypothetical protein